MHKPSYVPGTFTKSTVLVGSARPQPPRFVVRRRHIARVVALVLALALIYLCGYEPPYHGTLVVGTPRPLIFANRADGDGVERALNAGLDGADVEAQFTSEGQLVIAGLQGGPAQRFEDVVRSVNRRGTILVELKAGRGGSTSIEQRAVEIIRRFDAHLSVVLGSFDPIVLYRVKQIDPLVRTALIVTDTEQAEPAEVSWVLRQEFVRRAIRKFVQVDMLSIDYRVRDVLIDGLIRKGWPTFIWTPETEADIRRAISKHPYGVISDQPILARRLRGE